jgi:hypothetical protein
VIGNAVRIMRIATGEIADDTFDPSKQLACRGGTKGGPARAKALSARKRKEVAQKATGKIAASDACG